MKTTVIVGTQWGDEGKGCLCDYLAAQADIVVRYQGGNNAGHTVVVGDQEFKFHLIPSGILHPGKLCIMADGTVIDPFVLNRELEDLKARGVDTSGLRVSGAAHVIMPYHIAQDILEEKRRGDRKIGTTSRGIGPAYADKSKRCGIRVGDLLKPDVLRARVRDVLEEKNVLFTEYYHAAPLDPVEIADQVLSAVDGFRAHIADTRALLIEAVRDGRAIVFEGAQATYLDLDYGTYPNVTSSHPVAGAACLGTGVGPRAIDDVIGVAKAYTTRVGSGPFPTELTDALGDQLRERGGEYGTTTGRPRRCGWLDGVMVACAATMNSLSALAVTKLDVLDELETVRICVGYRINGETVTTVPMDPSLLDDAEPLYEDLPGWREDITEARCAADLPANARRYIDRVSEIASVPVRFVSVGPERSQLVVLGA